MLNKYALVKPWQHFDGAEESYGPSAFSFVIACAVQVRDKFGRPEAVRLIQLFGEADTLAAVEPKRYEILTRAFRYKLTGIDPGPADLWPSESENPGIFESEINARR